MKTIWLLLPWWVRESWYWLYYYRRGKIKYVVWDLGGRYKAAASNGRSTVINCYGSTPEQAREMATFRLKKATEENNGH
ncbi:hypothetical protein J1P26_22095 [Neobacillus sp. MM2021_6]|uniref:hypothetical protein n=1 Tax=Bacillaceae TaxID=186817 RepID=UPI0014090414|nr:MULTISPECIES: hypothetical protein [Bacillaceae]MBO0962397.1 hypothetical protein [Neobacillus sp. MM2021_6]NHC21034.1 hypothetical protein [Bacillus sp. MM2020_4]